MPFACKRLNKAAYPAQKNLSNFSWPFKELLSLFFISLINCISECFQLVSQGLGKELVISANKNNVRHRMTFFIGDP
jgi:hypothetical protein